MNAQYPRYTITLTETRKNIVITTPAATECLYISIIVPSASALPIVDTIYDATAMLWKTKYGVIAVAIKSSDQNVSAHARTILAPSVYRFSRSMRYMAIPKCRNRTGGMIIIDHAGNTYGTFVRRDMPFKIPEKYEISKPIPTVPSTLTKNSAVSDSLFSFLITTVSSIVTLVCARAHTIIRNFLKNIANRLTCAYGGAILNKITHVILWSDHGKGYNC